MIIITTATFVVGQITAPPEATYFDILTPRFFSSFMTPIAAWSKFGIWALHCARFFHVCPC